MRNYLQKLLREIKPRFYPQIARLQQQSIDRANATPLNSVRGTIEGEGTVINCFIYGKVRLGKGAILANSIVDQYVAVDIGERSIVTDCGFHPTILNDHLAPVEVSIGPDSQIGYVWTAESTKIGRCSIVAFTQIHEQGTTYSRVVSGGTEIEEGAFIYGSYLCTRYDSGDPDVLQASLKIGKDTFIWRSSLDVSHSSLTIGDSSTFCDYLMAMRVAFKGEDLLNEANGYKSLPERVSDIGQKNSFSVGRLTATVGNNFLVATNISIGEAFEKLKQHTVTIGDNVVLTTTHPGSSQDHVVHFHIHNMVVHNDATLVTAGESWYMQYPPVRNLIIGAGSTWIVEAGSSEFTGLDLTIPARTFTTV